MMKNFYILGWFLLIAAVFVTLSSASFDTDTLLVFSLVASALVSTLAMWSVIGQTRKLKTE